MGTRTRTRFVLPLIALFVLFSVLCLGIDSVEDVRPQITVLFDENVIITNYFLINIDDSKEYPLDFFQENEKTFVFVPAKSLSNGQYRLTVFATDLISNPGQYDYVFEVFVPGTRIFLVEPNSIGVANSTTFPVSVYTSRPSVCKHTGISVGSFDDVRLKMFSITGNLSEGDLVHDHTISTYSVQPDLPKSLYVVCQDDLGRENFEDFKLYSDVTPPRLTSVIVSPSPIVEYPPAGDLSSVLKVTASEPVLCRYTQDPNASFTEMTVFDADSYDINDFDAYHENNEKEMGFPGDIVKETFTFYVQCEDRARWKSSRTTKPITIDLTEGLKIHVVSPPAFSRNTDVYLNVTTNKRSYCSYLSKESGTGDPTAYTDPGAQLSSFENLTRVHGKHLGQRSSGSHPISIRCVVPEGVGLEPDEAIDDYTYVIDTTPPSTPKVNATTPVCDNTLEASFFANDTQSGISGYNWSVGKAGVVFARGSTTDESVSVSNYANGSSFVLSSTERYFFNVAAIDGAGNKGETGVSNDITFDDTGTGCDRTPPTVTLVKSEAGDSVILDCIDEESGCNSLESRIMHAILQKARRSWISMLHLMPPGLHAPQVLTATEMAMVRTAFWALIVMILILT
jgi:hypothetical protein